MASTAMVHVRVDEKIKAQATETLAAMGLSVSDAVCVFLIRVVADKQMPFARKAPSAKTRTAMAEAHEIARTRQARFDTATALFDELKKKPPPISVPRCRARRTMPNRFSKTGNDCHGRVGMT